MKKNLKNKSSPINKKCITCENFNKAEKCCKVNKNCTDTTFSVCDKFVIRDKLINF